MDLMCLNSVLLGAAEACKPDCPIALIVAGVAGLIIGFMIGRLSGKSAGRKGSKSAAHGGSGNKDMIEIYVGNLSYDMTESQMRKEFEKFGTVFSARIITNRFNQKSKGFGFIEMPNRSEAEAAIKGLNDKDVLGRKLRVNEAKNKSRE